MKQDQQDQLVLLEDQGHQDLLDQEVKEDQQVNVDHQANLDQVAGQEREDSLDLLVNLDNLVLQVRPGPGVPQEREASLDRQDPQVCMLN